MSKRKPFDLKSPEAQTLRDEIVHGTFVKEGTLVAFPLCFPGCSAPVVADESHITALDVAPNWMVYAGTSGRRTHLVVGMFHGATGIVFDMGAVDDATECTAICCGTQKFAAFVNGPSGGRAIRRALQRLPFDLLQEWGFGRQPFHDLGPIVEGERVLHAVADPTGTRAVGATDHHLFTLSLEEGEPQVIAEIPGAPRLAAGASGSIFGLDDGRALWRLDPATATLERNAVPLPQGTWGAAPLVWAKDPTSATLYTADADGRLFAFTEGQGFRGPLGQTRYAPVAAMAVTLDGRLFGVCGEGIGRLFCLDPARGELSDLGCAVSVIQRRRYGYQFADAALGRDGQVYFAEDDDLGHLWIYFPRIATPRPGSPA